MGCSIDDSQFLIKRAECWMKGNSGGRGMEIERDNEGPHLVKVLVAGDGETADIA